MRTFLLYRIFLLEYYININEREETMDLNFTAKDLPNSNSLYQKVKEDIWLANQHGKHDTGWCYLHEEEARRLCGQLKEEYFQVDCFREYDGFYCVTARW